MGLWRERLKHVGGSNLVLHRIHRWWGLLSISPSSVSASCLCSIEAKNVGKESGIDQNCPGPLQVRSAPARGGPDSNFGVAPAQVRSGQARASPDGAGTCWERGVGRTETALKSRAVNNPVPRLFGLFAPTIGGKLDAQPTLFLGVALAFPLLTVLNKTNLSALLFLFPLSQDTPWLSDLATFSSAAITIAGCNSSSRYRSPAARPQRGNKSTLTLLLRPTAYSEFRTTLQWAFPFQATPARSDPI